MHGAAGWQMNAHAFAAERELGLDYASDTRGRGPFVPVLEGGAVGVPQLPTTLPTLDELIGVEGATADDAAARVLELSREAPPQGHVYTLHAELEGGRLAPQFGRLLEGWRALGYELVVDARALRRARSGGAAALPRARGARSPGARAPSRCRGARREVRSARRAPASTSSPATARATC